MKKILLAWACLLLPFVAHAYDFEVDGIYYDITSDSTVAVTYLYDYRYNESAYSGDIVIPDTVTYNSVKYSVTSIRNMAFSYCTELTGITIPNSVTAIGGFEFYNCI